MIHWTQATPKEPGWYWIRESKESEKAIPFHHVPGWPSAMDKRLFLWWPEPIVAPPIQGEEKPAE